ELNFTPDWG
nr:adipokinetic hormone-like brain factor BI [Locusta sp.]